MLDFDYDERAFDDAFNRLERTIDRAGDLREMEEPITRAYANRNRQNFDGRGALVGGWQELTPATMREKDRLGFGGAGPVVRTGVLERSLTEPGAEGFVSEFRKDEARLYSAIPYAGPQNAMRQLVPDPDTREMERIAQEHAEKVAREEGFKPE